MEIYAAFSLQDLKGSKGHEIMMLQYFYRVGGGRKNDVVII